MDAESDLKAKMIRYQATLIRQRTELKRLETSANSPSTSDRQTRSSTNRVNQIMDEHKEMMLELKKDIGKLPFELSDEEVKFYKMHRMEFKEKERRASQPNFDEIITEAENVRRMQPDNRTERDALIISVTDIYNLVNLIVAKFEQLSNSIKC